MVSFYFTFDRLTGSMSRGGSAARGRRKLERQTRGDHPAHVEDGHVESGCSRGSSFKKSVTGLVRRVSQRVTRENKGRMMIGVPPWQKLQTSKILSKFLDVISLILICRTSETKGKQTVQTRKH